MTTNSQPASANRAGRQHAQALSALQHQAATSAQPDPITRWHQLLAEEAELQQLEALATCWNIRCSHALWSHLHDRSEALSRDMAACIALMQQEGR